MILLGWEIGTGRRVEIPETGHLAWFGQTQLSGKTTALEAIAFRGELKAVAFITKQGEGGFLTGRMIPPYFSEPTNDEEQPLWRWVKSILEAGQQRRMNFEESWIIRACEDPRIARTLADVHANIKALLAGEKREAPGKGRSRGKTETKWIRKPVSGINAGVYTSLKAYFDIVMPQLARLPYTKKLVLGPGLNVMDLREYAMETQALVIRSVAEWIYQHESGVRMILPECQDFIPQGRNSPVKMAAEAYIRKGGARKNFMWFDSQDMAAVDKSLLRQCSVLGVGVQTEMHEIGRSLDSIFSPTLKPIDLARLKVGEFFVRVPEAKVSKVYVQPAWMESELHAQAIAKGEESVSSARQMLRAFKDRQREVTDYTHPANFIDDAHHLKDPKMMVGAPHSLREYSAPQLKQILSQEPLYPESLNGGQCPIDDEGPDEVENDVEEDQSVSETVSMGATRDQGSNYGIGATVEDGDVGSGVDTRTVGRSAGFQTKILSDTEIPSPQSQIEEPGKHDPFTESVQGKQTESPRDFGFPGQYGFSEIVREEESVDSSVLGTSVRSGDGSNRGESEGAMPQAENPEVRRLRNYYEKHVRLFSSMPDGFEENFVAFLGSVQSLIEAHDALAARLRGESATAAKPVSSDEIIRFGAKADHLAAPPGIGNGGGNGLRFTVPELETIYQYVKSQILVDPTIPPHILEIMTSRPELRVKVERQVIHAKGDTMDGRLALLVHEGFFDKPRDRSAVGAELRRRGALADKANLKILSPYLAKLTSYGFLTREGDEFKAVPEMKKQVATA